MTIPADDTMPTDETVRVELWSGDREALRPSFELAEDSVAQLDSYINDGRVLVAVAGGQVVGHLQVVAADRPGELELKNMAVREADQGRGIGARLVRAAIDLVAGEGAVRLLVATGAADVGNLRFYQRLGFRMRSVERDAFVPETGYPEAIVIDGIELRDRVWFDQDIPSA